MDIGNSEYSDDTGNLPQMSDKPSLTSHLSYKMDCHVEDEIDFEEEEGSESEMAETGV